MQRLDTPAPANMVVFLDAIRRDPITARRAALVNILWHERYLTRDQLIMRVELRLGKHIFGKTAWEDNFYRDMRLVKEAFRAAGMQIAYSRNPRQSGYYLVDQPAISHELRQVIQSSLAENDPRQIMIYCRLSPTERFRQGCSISNTARKSVSFRIMQQQPGMDPTEANRLALARAYRPR